MHKHGSKLELSTAIVATLTLFACGGGGTGEENQAPEAGEAPAAEAPGAASVENAATVQGKAVFQGSAPAMAAIDMSEEQVCADKHQSAGGAKKEEVVVGAAGGLQNVFVYVKEGAQPSAAPAEAVVIDQSGCVYRPHVMGLRVGQKLTIKNSDGILHNINAKPSANRGFNISQPTTMESSRTFNAKEVMIPIQCDVHGWMQAYIGVLDHPYYAVTGNDGSFTISNLPPGTYTLEAWHEKYGTQTAQVTVGPSETKDQQFTFSAQSANAVPLGAPIDLHDHSGK